MTLVGYSDSEGSDSEPDAKPAVASKSQANVNTPSKAGFEKLVNRAEPHKIKVALPQASPTPNAPGADEATEPASKRPRLGAGGGGGFNALLPAPKRTSAVSKTTATNEGTKPRGLGRGVSLKTGAAPGFTREPMPQNYDGEDDAEFSTALESGSTPTTASTLMPAAETKKPEPPEVKTVGNPIMFKPMSVARKPAKKKALPLSNGPTSTSKSSSSAQNSHTQSKALNKPKISLFSIGGSDIDSASEVIPAAQVGSLDRNVDAEPFESASDDMQSKSANAVPQPDPLDSAPSDNLSTVADSLNLSAAERRQLFGRQNAGAKSASAVSLVNFNADNEWASNEALRQAGELDKQQPHNPVRAIAPGKHSLRQLVNAVAGQRDALEESFAAGKRNRKEAGSKYGW